jgi:DNA-directed RNA polymerase subunit E"
MRELACRKCKALTTGKVCPVCHSQDLSADWFGLVLITNIENSYVAKILKITKPGRYALRVS